MGELLEKKFFVRELLEKKFFVRELLEKKFFVRELLERSSPTPLQELLKVGSPLNFFVSCAVPSNCSRKRFGTTTQNAHR